MNQVPTNSEFLFGGTFDPVHFGHLAIIDALQALAPHIPVRLIPCALPALKTQPDTLFEHRTTMLGLATRERQNIIIDQREADREGASFTVETLSSLRHEFPHKAFILVIGGDSLLDLKRWHQWQKLPPACHLLVINRPGIKEKTIRETMASCQFIPSKAFQLLTQQRSGLGFFLKMPEKLVSSTQIRHSIENNLELDSMLPQSVIKYIRDHHLYTRESI